MRLVFQLPLRLPPAEAHDQCDQVANQQQPHRILQRGNDDQVKAGHDVDFG